MEKVFPTLAGAGRQDVVQHGHSLEDAHILPGTDHSRLHQFVRGRIGQILSANIDGALVGAEEASNQIEKRCFATAVRPDQAGDFARRQSEGNIRHRLEAAEGFGYPLHLQDRLPGFFPGLRRPVFLRRVAIALMPFGPPPPVCA